MSAGALLDDVRRSLHLGPAEEQALRAAAPLLQPEVPAWVDAFYARLATDPVAMALLQDEGRIVRLKRSLIAWFHEIFALPLDASYARAREEIGRRHVRIGMPAFLMVTSMSHLRAVVRRSVTARLAADPERAERVARAAEKHLDLELAMMLSTYARHSRQAERRRDRAVLLEGLVRGSLGGLRDALDAALCYLELLRSATTEAERAQWAQRLGEVLRLVGRGDARGLEALAALDDVVRRVPVAALVEAARDALPPEARARVGVRVESGPDTALVRAAPLRQALTDVLRRAVAEGTGPVTATVRADDDAGLVVDVESPGVGDASAPDPALAFAELVADLHGGALEPLRRGAQTTGMRLRLLPAEATQD